MSAHVSAAPFAAPARGRAILAAATAVGPALGALAYAAGVARGPLPLLATLAFAALLWGSVRAPRRAALACFALAGGVFLALAAGLVPGFARYPLGDASINTAKGIAGLAALAMFPSFWAWNHRCTAIAAACLVLLPALSLAAGLVHWRPASGAAVLAFAAANAFTAIGEEWFFRHWIQRPLQRWGHARAITVSALLFGLVHAGGGVAVAGQAALAGVAYAGVYAASGGSLRAAAALHLAVNLLRVALFGL